MRSRKGVTAAELMARLSSDPEYRRRQELMEVKIEANRFAYRRLAAGVLEDLKQKGFNVQSVGELRLRGGEYHDAIPVLLQWLQKVTDRNVKEDILRTLSVAWAGQVVAPVFLREFQLCKDEYLRWVIGNGLGITADQSMLPDLLNLARDVRYGPSRTMIVLALGRFKGEPVVAALIDLLDDRDVVMFAIMALGKLRAVEARTHIESLLEDPIPDIRKEAKKALAAIDRIAKRRRSTVPES
jgi:hypothetical protein